MKVSNLRLDLALARQKKSLRELRGEGVSPQTLTRIRRGEEVKPKTVGFIAAALGIDPAEIIEVGREAKYD